MSAIQVQRGTTAVRTFETLARANGDRTAPAALPTAATAHVNGVINSTLQAAITIATMQDATPATIVGYYKLEFSTGALAANDDVDITIQATINGTLVRTVLRFLIIDVPGLIPEIK